jgi:hypothetical protein
MADQGHLSLITVLEDEYVSLHGSLPSTYDRSEKDDEKRLADLYKHIRNQKEKRSALCVSGGGIRSASFGLGVLQGLARYGLLKKFDYLSTVSGGGYLGSWLSAWIDRHPDGLDGVAKDLASQAPRPPIDPEPEPIRNLRKYSNYMSPRLGLLSADSWTLAATVVRNLILIWLVLIPILAAVLMIPRICVSAIKWPLGESPTGFWLTFGFGLVAALVAVAYVGINRPSVAKSNRTQERFLLLCWVPLLLSAILLTTCWAWLRQTEDRGMRSAMALDSEVRTAQAKKDAEQKPQAEKLAVGTYTMTISKEGLEKGSPATAQTQQQAEEQRKQELRDKRLAASAQCLEEFLKDIKNEIKDYDAFVEECTETKLQNLPKSEEEKEKEVTIEQRFAERMEKRLADTSILGLRVGSSLLLFLILGAVLQFSGWLVSALWLKRLKFLEALLAAITGAVGGWLSWLVAIKMFPHPTSRSEFYVSFASPLFLAVFLLSVTLLAGLSSRRSKDDADREWWARLGAWGLIAAACWVVVSCLVILGPPMLSKLPALLAPLGGISGLVTLLMGRSSKTSAKEQQEKKTLPSIIADNVMLFATGVFAAFLIIIVSSLTSLLVWWLASKLPFKVDWHFSPASESAFFPSDGPFGDLKIILHSPLWFVVTIASCLAILSFVMASLINTNKFSLHAMYRNRLIRAYLGASRSDRDPNGFTGFDENDNVPMHSLWPAEEGTRPGNTNRKKLLHVINMALNLVHGSDLAWQQRKAESFTSSPLHSGNYQLGYRKSKEYGGRDGISLGTAVTISGAAASPNMGYHSSPFVAFLLTLFNGRLGAWLGNPGRSGEKTYRRSSPGLSLIPIVKEAFGLTNNQARYVYLSDGGHFENLGIYEMVLRRCHIIVVSDASQDSGCNFEDLGAAVRKIRIDQGIPIDFEQEICIFGRSDEKSQNDRGKYCAVGKIRYSKVDGTKAEDGILVYIKPAFYGNEPRDIYQYAKANLLFPHESTADQFFSESQFESYRMLGEHAVETICKTWPKDNWGDLVNFALQAKGLSLAKLAGGPAEAAPKVEEPD